MKRKIQCEIRYIRLHQTLALPKKQKQKFRVRNEGGDQVFGLSDSWCTILHRIWFESNGFFFFIFYQCLYALYMCTITFNTIFNFVHMTYAFTKYECQSYRSGLSVYLGRYMIDKCFLWMKQKIYICRILKEKKKNFKMMKRIINWNINHSIELFTP